MDEGKCVVVVVEWTKCVVVEWMKGSVSLLLLCG